MEEQFPLNAAASGSGGIASDKIRARIFAFTLALAALITAAGFLAATVRPAEALPSYARQTGQPCAACHTAFPADPLWQAVQDRGLYAWRRRLEGAATGRYDVHAELHPYAIEPGTAARPGTAHERQSRLTTSRVSLPASFTAMSARSFRLRATRPSPTRCSWTPPTSATPTRSHSLARTRSGASTPTIRRPWRTRGIRRPRLAGRKSLRPSPRLSARR